MSKKNDYEKQGMTVTVHNNDISRALRKLKKKMQVENVLQDLKRKEFYEKPSIKRKRAKDSARKRHLRDKAKRNMD